MTRRSDPLGSGLGAPWRGWGLTLGVSLGGGFGARVVRSDPGFLAGFLGCVLGIAMSGWHVLCLLAA